MTLPLPHPRRGLRAVRSAVLAPVNWALLVLGRHIPPPPTRPVPHTGAPRHRPRRPGDLALDVLLAAAMAHACACETWWSSAGTEHDPDCPTLAEPATAGDQLLLTERMLTVTDTDLAQAAYTAYGQATGGRNFLGDPMPDWDDLGDTIQGAWVAATIAVRTASVRGAADFVDTFGETIREADGRYPDEWSARECRDAVQAAAAELRDTVRPAATDRTTEES